MIASLYLRKLILILICVLAFLANSKAQTYEPKFRLLEGADGITFGKINDMVRDRHGVIWFADQSNGLIRYDGTHVTVYPHDMQNPNSLGGPNPEDMLIDSNGIFWISFWGTGLDRFDPETGEFIHYRHQKDDQASVSNDSISAILIDHVGNLWVGTNQGLDLLDQQTGKFKHYKHDPKDPASLSFNLVRSLYEDREGTLWIGTGMAWETHQKGGLNKFHRDSENFTRYLHDPKDPQSLINNKVRSIFEDSHGNFWVGTAGDGLHSMDRKTGKFTRHLNDPKNPHQLARPPVTSENGDHITFIMEDVEGQMWIGTWNNGINRYNPITKEITYFGNEKGGLNDNRIWIARSFDDGLFWLSSDVPSANLYQVDLFTSTIPFIPVSGAVGVNRFFQDDPDILWMATQGGGLIKKDLTNQRIQSFRHDPDNPKSVSSDNVSLIMKDKKGFFWLGTDNGLNKFDSKTKEFTRYQHDEKNKESITGAPIIALYEDHESNIWIGTWAGLDKFNPQTEKFAHYVNTKDTTSLSGNIVIGILEDAPGELWVCIWNGGGINRLNTKTGKAKHYLKGINAGHIFRDREGVIWVGTGSGLFKYNQSTDNFSLLNYNEAKGMNEEIRTNLCDQSDNIWLATSKNIISLNKERTISYTFGKENQVNIIWYLSSYNTLDGQLLFGTDGGYYAINPTELKVNPQVPKIEFTDFWIGNESINSSTTNTAESFDNKKEVRLSHEQNIFSVGFSITDFSSSTQKVIYTLEGYDLNWRQPGSEGRAYYFNVPPGTYTFTVKARNGSNANWQERKIAIHILPPWWRTWWAYGSFGVVFIGLVFSVDRFQRSRLLKRAEAESKEKELAQAREIEKAYTELKATQSQLIQSEKMASLGELTAGIAHEIQNPLNFVNNFSEINAELIDELKKELAVGSKQAAEEIANDIKSNSEKINHHGKRADAIVKGMLQHSRSSSGVKEPTDINVLADEYLRLAYHGLRAKDKSFNATMKTDFDESIVNINIIPQDIGRVILNLITNAFYAVSEKKKAEDGKYEPTVSVSTRKNGDKILISVKDNGNGIPQKVLDKIFQPFFTTKPTGQGTGLGLSMSYDIVKAHGGELKVQTKEGEGAEFIIIFPLS